MLLMYCAISASASVWHTWDYVALLNLHQLIALQRLHGTVYCAGCDLSSVRVSVEKAMTHRCDILLKYMIDYEGKLSLLVL